jgi:hypothetical protein
MTLTILLLITAASLAYVLPPLFRGDDRPSADAAAARLRIDTLADASSRRDIAYEAIGDLDFDFAAGKISQEDFAKLKRQYQAAAVEALKELDSLRSAETP